MESTANRLTNPYKEIPYVEMVAIILSHAHYLYDHLFSILRTEIKQPKSFADPTRSACMLKLNNMPTAKR